MTKSRLLDGTEQAVFVHEVAKQHDVFADAIAFEVLVSARAGSWLDKMIRKLFEVLQRRFAKTSNCSTDCKVCSSCNKSPAAVHTRGLVTGTCSKTVSRGHVPWICFSLKDLGKSTLRKLNTCQWHLLLQALLNLCWSSNCRKWTFACR